MRDDEKSNQNNYISNGAEGQRHEEDRVNRTGLEIGCEKEKTVKGNYWNLFYAYFRIHLLSKTFF